MWPMRLSASVRPLFACAEHEFAARGLQSVYEMWIDILDCRARLSAAERDGMGTDEREVTEQWLREYMEAFREVVES